MRIEGRYFLESMKERLNGSVPRLSYQTTSLFELFHNGNEHNALMVVGYPPLNKIRQVEILTARASTNRSWSHFLAIASVVLQRQSVGCRYCFV